MARRLKHELRQKHRVFLVEDHPVTREGLAQLLNQQADLEVCGQAGSAREALDAVEASAPDLVLVDISLAETSGIELIKDLTTRHKELRILVLSTHDETLYAERSLRAGARGFVMKHEPTAQVMAAIRLVLGGGIYLSQRMRGRLLHKLARRPAAETGSDLDQLSDRELEVFQLIGRGHSTAQIAAGLNVSVSTVETHRAHIKQKLRLENASELVQRAVEWVQRAAS
jgi:DNA-binding NarL/FixJ family response regulator